MFYFLSVPAILNEAVPATTQNVDSEIQQTLDTTYKYTGRYHKNNIYITVVDHSTFTMCYLVCVTFEFRVTVM